jgi:hypothetical protein
MKKATLNVLTLVLAIISLCLTCLAIGLQLGAPH